MAQVQKQVQLGILFVLVYDILSSLKAVYLGSLFQSLSPIVLAVYTFSLMAVFFWIVSSLCRHRSFPSHWRNDKKNLIAMNFSTTFSWLGFFCSLKYLEPSLASALTLAIGPTFSLFMGRYLRPGSPFDRLEKVAAFGLFLCVGAIAFTTWTGKSAVGTLAPHDVLVGFTCTMFCGFGVVGNTYFSKRLYEAGWAPSQIMAQRFYLLIAVGILLWPAGHACLPGSFLLGKIFAITVFGLIIPIYSLHLGIQQCEPITVSMILALAPFVTLIVQSFDRRLFLSTSSLITTVVVILFTFVGIAPRLKSQNT
jgi:drug/metabolite transporter (DMT)-like permease